MTRMMNVVELHKASQEKFKPRAEDLYQRAQELKKAGAVAQMTKGPALVEETGAFMVEMAERLDTLMEAAFVAAGIFVEVKHRMDALTPYRDEGGAA